MIRIKTVLITGASGDIGQAIATSFAKEGYNVVCQYFKNRDGADKLKNELDKLNAQYIFVQADVTIPSDVENLFKAAKERFGFIDVLVNNAGIALSKLITETTNEEWQNVISTNLSGTFYTSKEALKDMIKNHKGSIINIASMWGEVGASMEVAYSASKAGIIGFTKALAKEVGPSHRDTPA